MPKEFAFPTWVPMLGLCSSHAQLHAGMEGWGDAWTPGRVSARLASAVGLWDGLGGDAGAKCTKQFTPCAQRLHLQSGHRNLCSACIPGSPSGSDELWDLRQL